MRLIVALAALGIGAFLFEVFRAQPSSPPFGELYTPLLYAAVACLPLAGALLVIRVWRSVRGNRRS
jgi:hypothetical protein